MPTGELLVPILLLSSYSSTEKLLIPTYLHFHLLPFAIKMFFDYEKNIGANLFSWLLKLISVYFFSFKSELKTKYESLKIGTNQFQARNISSAQRFHSNAELASSQCSRAYCEYVRMEEGRMGMGIEKNKGYTFIRTRLLQNIPPI